MPTPDAPSLESRRVLDQLRTEIVDGVRAPGSKLVERDLAIDLGVSRVPVRDALQRLGSEGLVVLRPRTWATVRTFSSKDIADLHEVRETMEERIFTLAARRHTSAGLAKLRTAVDDELGAALSGDAAVARRRAADFHEIATELAANDLLGEIARTLSSRMRWLLGQHDDLVAIAREHEALWTAVARRDVTAVSRLVAEHLATSKRQYEARLAADQPL